MFKKKNIFLRNLREPVLCTLFNIIHLCLYFSENNRVDDALPFIDGMLYDDAVTNTIIDQCSVITGRNVNPSEGSHLMVNYLTSNNVTIKRHNKMCLYFAGRSKSEIYELFGSMFYEFCEHAGYKEMYNTLSNNLCEFLQGLNTLNHHVTNKYPAVRLPLFQVSPDHDESLRVSCHTTRLHFEHVLIGMIREVAKRLHNIDVAIKMTQPDEPLPNRIQLKVQVPSGVSPSIITNTLNHNVDVLNTDTKINPATLCQLFPFHIMFDSRLKIVQAGVAVSRVIKEIDNQMLSFRDIFQFVDPDIDCTYDEILAHTQSIFVVRVRDRIRLSPRRSIGDKTTSSTVGSPLQQSPLLGGRRLGHDINDDEHKKRMRLKGQMLPLEDKEHVIFLCSANVHDLDELLERGLYLGDVPLHDSTRDLILLNEQFRAENDLAHKLEQVTETLQQTYRDLEAEKQLTDKLVYSILPPTVANKLRLNQPVEAVKYNCVTILFSGICDFDWFYSNNSPMKVVYLLNELYTKFDNLVKTNEADVYKVYAAQILFNNELLIYTINCHLSLSFQVSSICFFM